jgi:hypothetical protein
MTRSDCADLNFEWQRQGATLSDKSARKEFGLTQDQIVQGIRAGKLHYQQASMHYGSIWTGRLVMPWRRRHSWPCGRRRVLGERSCSRSSSQRLVCRCPTRQFRGTHPVPVARGRNTSVAAAPRCSSQ